MFAQVVVPKGIPPLKKMITLLKDLEAAVRSNDKEQIAAKATAALQHVHTPIGEELANIMHLSELLCVIRYLRLNDVQVSCIEGQGLTRRVFLRKESTYPQAREDRTGAICTAQGKAGQANRRSEEAD